VATITKVTTSKGEVRYRVRAVVGHRPDGTAKQELRTCATKKEALAWAAQREADVARGVAVADTRTTLGQYLGEWLTRSERRVRPITVAGYRWLIERWIVGTELASTPLGRLSPAAVQKWIDAIPRPASARKARAVLAIALAEASRLGLVAANPVSRTTAPAHTPRQGTSWSSKEARRFLVAAEGDPYSPFWQLAVYLGMRPSEIAGLRWEAVDLDAGTLRVERARPTAMGRTFDSDKTKSEAGKRTLALPPALVAVLRAHKARQNEQRLLLGQDWPDHGLVCTGTTGAPLDQRAVQRRFVRLCAKAGVTRVRVYDSRHTATSLMLDAGADLKAASEALGHADPRITMKVYRHVRADQRARALALLADSLAPEDEPEAAAQ
jgi:integrase